nr:hypothetical protein BaRGS_009246 [Batillaria attramentaria]
MLNTTTSYNSSEQPAVDNLFIGLPVENSVRITVVILGWLACVTGIFGNVLIITTLLSQQSLRSVHNIYIANLALADLLVMGYVFPFWLLDLALGANPVANQTHCDANAFIIILTFVVSVYTLVLIACDRFMSVCHNPIYTKLFNRTSIVASCVVVWLLAGCEGMTNVVAASDVMTLQTLATNRQDS